MKELNLILILIICCLSISCTKIEPVSDEVPQPAPPPLNPYSGFAVSNQFGLKLYGTIYKKNPDSNLCISPFSVRTALSLIANGTAGEDHKEILKALNMTGYDLASLNEDYKHLAEYLMQADPKVTYEAANSFWYQNGVKVYPEFRTNLTDYYHAEAYPVNFSDPETLTLINNWVSDQTHGKIKTISNSIPPNTILNLTNAIYFNGEWTYKFDRKKTKAWMFDKTDRTYVPVPVMNNKQAYRYYSHTAWDGIELTYGNGEWAMYVFMPHKISPLDKLTTWLISNWETVRTQFTADDPIEIYFPEFTMENEFDLKTILPELGINRVFNPGADFSRMMDGPVYISKMTHKTYIKVNEDGTEAAGVTSAWFTGSSPGILFFDHPFMYIIAERSTGLILFIGQVMDPS